MNISIFGLGYVGCVILGCLAKNGHNVIGVDINKSKVNLINKGKATIVEKDIDTIINEQRKKSRISAVLDYRYAVLNSDVSIICVGTPSTSKGHLNLNYIYRATKQIGETLVLKNSFHVIVIRSTVPPGTNRKAGEIIEKASGKKRNVDFAVVSNPEFLREGSAVKDYYNPALTVLGSDSDKTMNIMKSLYADINAPIITTEIEVAEIIKFINNTFHACKICFANEVGNICKKLGIDSHKVMNIFCMDDQLNISTRYLMPGFAYGGSCLPKDIKALKNLSKNYSLSSPVIESLANSNENQKKVVLEMIESTGKKKIGIIGLSFKQGTDDLRCSPTVDIVENLYKKGYEVNIWDKNVHISKLIGSNVQFINKHLPYISSLITDNIEDVIQKSECILITQKINNFNEIIKRNPEKIFIDVIRSTNRESSENYIGISW